MAREYALYAKDENERELWMQSFAKVLDFNTQDQDTFNLKSPANSSHYNKEGKDKNTEADFYQS